jgi:hypothetical protein
VQPHISLRHPVVRDGAVHPLIELAEQRRCDGDTARTASIHHYDYTVRRANCAMSRSAPDCTGADGSIAMLAGVVTVVMVLS